MKYFLRLFFFVICKCWPIKFSDRLLRKFYNFFKKILFLNLLLLVNVCVYDVVLNHIYKEKNKFCSAVTTEWSNLNINIRNFFFNQRA